MINFLQAFRHGKFPSHEFVEKGLLDSFKKSLKPVDQLKAISDLPTNEERVSFHPGNVLGTFATVMFLMDSFE